MLWARTGSPRRSTPDRNQVVLEHLDDKKATAYLRSIYLELYHRTAHLKGQISEEDYLAIFESVWKDRARAAGWNLEISYESSGCIMHFTR